MGWIPDRYRELRSLLRRDRVEADVAEELEFHIEMRTQENMDAGMNREDARTEAMRRFGDVERIRQETQGIDDRLRRRKRLRDLIGASWRETRMAARSLVRRPAFSATALLTLTLGIGAVAAIFTVLEGIVLRPLPYAEPDELIWIESRVPGVRAEAAWGLSVAGYFAFKERNRSFDGIGAFVTASLNLSGDQGASRVRTAAVSAALLDVLDARPALGRLIEEEDDGPDGPSVVVLGHDFWQQEMGGDPSVIGSTVQLHGAAYEVIGVMAEGLDLPDLEIDAWRPLPIDPSAPPVNAHWLSAIGRLREDASLETAQADLASITGTFTERFPRAYPESFMRESEFATAIVPLREHVVGGVSRALWILFASVGLVLLIAGANVTNLFLVRSEGRRRELAIRAALGARRGQLIWHYLSESTLLALTAGAIAVLLAYGAVRLLVRTTPEGLPRLSELGLEPTTAAFTLAVAIVVGALLGTIPLAYRLVDYSALREGGRGLTASRKRSITRHAIVIGQVALALLLLTAAGLMLRSFQQLRSVEPGFDPQNVLTMQVALPFSGYGSYEDVMGFYRTLLTRVEALPGVLQAAATQRLPLEDVGGCAVVFVQDRPAAPDDELAAPCVGTAQVTPGFFSTLGIPVRGEAPTWSDMERRTGTVVVTEALAQRLWPGEDAIGKGIRGNGWAEPFYRVAGVADDFRSDGLDRPPLEAVFFPMLPMEGAPLWSPPRSLHIVVKTATANPAMLTPAIRRILGELDPTVPLADVKTMETVIDTSPSMARASFTMLLLGIAGGMALLLSGVGLYGLIAYTVGQRTTEIGVRIAVGAGLDRVVRMVITQSLKLAVAGVVLGLIGALILARLMRSLLFGVSPTDPITLAAVALVLILLALAASFLPARRAARVDPVEALRME
jgi:predicted permease